MNTDITFPEVRLIGSDGQAVGIVPIAKALGIAESEGLDLIAVSKDAKPPVCKIMDYGHYKYEREKQLKQSKKGSKATVIKELKMSPKISEHDYQVRYRAAVKFLDKGHKVKVTLNFKGREMAHTDIGYEVMKRFIADLNEVATVEVMPKLEGRRIVMMLAQK